MGDETGKLIYDAVMEATTGGETIYDAYGNTTSAGDVSKLQPLVEEWGGNGAVMNWANPDYENDTPLCFSTNYVAVFRVLMAAPSIDVNKAGGRNRPPIIWAVDNNKLEVVETLLTVPGIDVNKADEQGSTALSIAIQRNEMQIVGALLAAPGLNINSANFGGLTPVMWAAMNRRTEMLKVLLAAPGVDVNKSVTALDMVAGEVDEEAGVIAALLREAGAQ